MSDPATLGPPAMQRAEIEFFSKMLSTSRAYSEFGMGGSSLLAVRAGIGAIVLVDSDAKWVESVRKHPEIAAAIAAGKASLLHADIGPVAAWGTPVDRSEILRWHSYLAAPWAEWAKRNSCPDLVFVDGRFRVACCFSVVVATGGGRPVPSTRVMIHDFNDDRPSYRDVLEFFDIEKQVEGLCLLRMRPDASPAAALSRLLTRQFDYG